MPKSGHPARIMIDFSHANSSKDYRRQPIVCHDVAAQIAQGNPDIIGVMIESNLVAGAQKLRRRPTPCLRPEHHRRLPSTGLKPTPCLAELAASVRTRRR